MSETPRIRIDGGDQNPDMHVLAGQMREALRQYRTGATATVGDLTVMCPYCGKPIQVTERDATSLTAWAEVHEPTRIDISFLSRHRCSTPAKEASR